MDNMDIENLINYSIDMASALEKWQIKDKTFSLNDMLNYEKIIHDYMKEYPFANTNDAKAYLLGYVRGTAQGMRESWAIMSGDD